MTNLDRVLKSTDITLLTKVYGLSSSQVQMEKLYIKKPECQELMPPNCGAGESPFDCKAIKPVNPKGNQP